MADYTGPDIIEQVIINIHAHIRVTYISEYMSHPFLTFWTFAL